MIREDVDIQRALGEVGAVEEDVLVTEARVAEFRSALHRMRQDDGERARVDRIIVAVSAQARSMEMRVGRLVGRTCDQINEFVLIVRHGRFGDRVRRRGDQEGWGRRWVQTSLLRLSVGVLGIVPVLLAMLIARGDVTASPRSVGVSEVHHFAYGWISPVLGFVLAFLGSLLSLVLAGRAREAVGWSRARWLIMSGIALGGIGMWLMHFMAILGFDVPDTLIRYDPKITVASFALSVVMVAIGLFLAAFAMRPSALRIVAGGIVSGTGVAAMHYSGMSALMFSGTLSYDPALVGASFAMAIVASTVALWFAAVIRGASATVAGALLMGVAVCGMHYTGMAAVRIDLAGDLPPVSGGMSAFELLAPIAVLACVMISSLAYATVGFTVLRENDQEALMLARARAMYETATVRRTSADNCSRR